MSASPSSLQSACASAPPSVPQFSSKSDLKNAILTAILAERARKAERRAAGLPDTESSDDSSDGETRSRPKSQTTTTDNKPAISKNDYGLAEYWNARYMKTKGLFDWYVDYAHLSPLLDEFGSQAYAAIYGAATTSDTPVQPATQPEPSSETASSTAPSFAPPAASFPRSAIHLLDIGCGNSGLAEDLYKHGWHRQTHIDISDVIIDRMKQQYVNAPDTYGEWITMDATKMTFPSNHIDFMLEKGTIDALDCTPEEEKVVSGILSECARVLKPGGVLLIITHGSPRRRLPVLQSSQYGWDVETRAIGYSNSALFIRLLRKKMQGRPIAQAPPAIMAECAAEVRETKLQMDAELQRARQCIARVESEFAGRAAGLEPDEQDADDAESEVFSPATSSICFVYACTKRRPTSSHQDARD